MADIVRSFDMTGEMKARLVLNITLDRSFMPRMWLATQMLRLVGLVCPITVSLDDRD